ncbi:MAG: DUF6496 domain-containing protein [Patescibacteria group bacterium]|jgi:hypothetical protein
MARQYGPKAQEYVHDVMHEFKHGKLRSRDGRTVTKRRQAVAIGLQKARKVGAKVSKQ